MHSPEERWKANTVLIRKANLFFYLAHDTALASENRQTTRSVLDTLDRTRSTSGQPQRSTTCCPPVPPILQ